MVQFQTNKGEVCPSLLFQGVSVCRVIRVGYVFPCSSELIYAVCYIRKLGPHAFLCGTGKLGPHPNLSDNTLLCILDCPQLVYIDNFYTTTNLGMMKAYRNKLGRIETTHEDFTKCISFACRKLEIDNTGFIMLHDVVTQINSSRDARVITIIAFSVLHYRQPYYIYIVSCYNHNDSLINWVVSVYQQPSPGRRMEWQ